MSAINWTTIKTALQAWFVAGSGLATARVIFAGQNLNRPAGDGAYIAIRLKTIDTIGCDWSDVEARPLTVAATSITSVDFATGVFTRAAHGRATGDGPILLTTTGTLPAGSELVTPYWFIRTGVNTFKLAESFLLAIAGTAITLTDAGLGVHTFTGTADTLQAGAEVTHYARGNRRVVLEATCYPPRDAEDATEAHAILSEVIAHAALPSRRTALSRAGIGMAKLGTVQQLDGVINSTRFEPRSLFTIAFHCVSQLSETGTIVETVNITEGSRTITVDLS